MPESNQIGREFYARPAVIVAREVLGQRLVRIENGRRISGIISEAEAYTGEEDLACHAKAGLTPRTKVMYGPAGHAYVYFTYGMHWMLNFVVEPENRPAAVLIRAILPEEGIDIIAARRGEQPERHWTDGPGKICQALDIDGRLNGADLCSPDSVLFIEKAGEIPDSCVTITPRVGLNTVPEPWKSMPWRYLIAE